MKDVSNKIDGLHSKVGGLSGTDFTRSSRFSLSTSNPSQSVRSKEKSGNGGEVNSGKKQGESALSKVVNESITMTSEVTHGLLAQVVKKVIFNNEIM